MARGVRQPAIAPGIYPDRFGFEVRVPGFTATAKPHRFAPNTPIAVMQHWQAEEKAYLLRCAIDDAGNEPAPATTRGTWQHDVDAYLKTREGRDGYKSDRSHAKAWTDIYGTRPRWKITRKDCEGQFSAWLKAGLSPKTLQHRRRIFREIWHHADGRKGRTPVDGISLPKTSRPAPVPVDHAILKKVAASLKKGLTITKGCGPNGTKAKVKIESPQHVYAAFLIYALTGARPSQIGRTRQGDVDFERRIWFMRPGKGGYQVPFPMDAQLAKAFRAFGEADGWEKHIDPASFTKTIRRHGWPADVEPYRMRHTFAIDQLESGTTLGDLQGLMGHTDPKTTRYYAPIAVSLMRKAVGRRKLKL